MSSEVSFPTKWVTEGRARILVPAETGLVYPSKLPVFYNPASKISRDIAVLVTEAYLSSGDRSLIEPLAGCGVRTIRLLLEADVFERGVMGDVNRDAAALMRINAESNMLKERVSIHGLDANLLLSQLAASGDRADYVDIDPSGSPAPYLENAYRAVIRGGLLGASATDIAALSGSSPSTAMWRYGAALCRTIFPREVAMRSLAGFAVKTAARLGLAATPILTVYHRHFTRIFTSVKRGRQKAREAISSIGYISYCPTCLATERGRELGELNSLCSSCGSRTCLLGPLWLGALSDRGIAERIVSSKKKDEPIYRAALGVISGIAQELQEVVTYYPVSELARRAKLPPPKPSRLIQALIDHGFRASTTHHDHAAIKTDAGFNETLSVMKTLY